jgi:uncharacterized protein (TIGR00661 family)
MRFLFIVQGEGRGHMTQAISLYQILSRQGHQLCAVLVGQSQSRLIPKFFVKQIQAPVFTFCSPNFQLDIKRRGVSIFGTFVHNVKHLPVFIKSLLSLRRSMRQFQPDVIVNFYDPLAAIYVALWRPKTKMVCIAHQYLMMHPKFVFPKGKRIARWAMLFFTRVCAWGADKCLALSFGWMPDVPKNNLMVVPPLLRAELKKMKPITENFILSYVLNDGYANDIAAEQRHYPEFKILGFWDRRECSGVTCLQANLEFRPLDDIAFLDAMRRCCGLVSTAGFESICEAMYLGKPVFMIPVKHQIEQHCNAIDAQREGVGLWDFDFDLADFLDYIPRHQANQKRFQNWVHSAEWIYPDLFSRLSDGN